VRDERVRVRVRDGPGRVKDRRVRNRRFRCGTEQVGRDG